MTEWSSKNGRSELKSSTTATMNSFNFIPSHQTTNNHSKESYNSNNNNNNINHSVPTIGQDGHYHHNYFNVNQFQETPNNQQAFNDINKSIYNNSSQLDGYQSSGGRGKFLVEHKSSKLLMEF